MWIFTYPVPPCPPHAYLASRVDTSSVRNILDTATQGLSDASRRRFIYVEVVGAAFRPDFCTIFDRLLGWTCVGVYRRRGAALSCSRSSLADVVLT